MEKRGPVSLTFAGVKFFDARVPVLQKVAVVMVMNVHRLNHNTPVEVEAVVAAR